MSDVAAGAGSFADADAEPQNKQLPKACREARGRGYEAPGKNADSQNSPPVEFVGHPAEWKTHDSVKERKCCLQQPQRSIAQIQLFAQRFTG